MALTEIGEPPDISQAHTKPYTGQHVLCLVVPFWSGVCLFFLQDLKFSMGRYPVLQARIGQLQLYHVLNFLPDSAASEG